ncbi:hypothetical protein F953_00479 [Acinetobacter junii CIP 107470 = MTCC 11364]|nr:hypothetical protein F953_00479 [Acinetobacter junii CIP 107470 = MTCC 11364]
MYLIVSISFIFYVTKLPISFDNLLKILTHNLYLFFMLLYCTTSLFYHLTMIARKSLLYINREITKLFLNNSIFNKTDYNYDNIYLIKKLKFK